MVPYYNNKCKNNPIHIRLTIRHLTNSSTNYFTIHTKYCSDKKIFNKRYCYLDTYLDSSSKNEVIELLNFTYHLS